MTKLSITTRITLWYAMFLIAVSVILIVVLYRYYDVREQSACEQKIIHTIEDVSDKISTNGRDYAVNGDIDYYSKSTYISVYDKSGAFFAGRIPEEAGKLPDIEPDRIRAFDDENGIQWYIYDTEIYMEDGDGLYIRGIMENTGYEILSKSMGRFLIFVIPALIIMAVVGGRLISRRALIPVRQLISVVNEIQDDGDLSRRVPVPESRDEARELATSINGLFDRIEKVVGRERQFTSDVSHELRTPLTVIRTQSEYAMEDPSYADQALKTINSESHHMSRMITSLLAISRSESGRLRPDLKDVDLRDMLSDLTEQMNIITADIDTEVVFVDETNKEDGEPLVIESDEDLLMRIIVNLMENAARYGKSEDGHIEVRLSDDGSSAVITVADDGNGIAEEDRSKVWNRFYRAAASRSRSDSSGLGLAMVASLTRALGGSVRIVPDDEKREGELPGAVFELKIPKKYKAVH